MVLKQSQIDQIKAFRLKYKTDKKNPEDDGYFPKERPLSPQERAHLAELGAKFEEELYKTVTVSAKWKKVVASL